MMDEGFKFVQTSPTAIPHDPESLSWQLLMVQFSLKA